MARRIKYRDAYGQEAVAIFNAVYGEWNITFLPKCEDDLRKKKPTKRCKSEGMIKVILKADGYEWTEVGRW